MHTRTSQKLKDIKQYGLFQSIGKAVSDDVILVESWAEAAKWCSSKACWQRCQLMSSNALSRMSQERDWEHASHWNSLVEEIKSAAHERILSACLSLENRSISPMVQNSLAWDVLMICMEVEFSDAVPPLFYLNYIDPWYQKGHFPCGWQGDRFPDGWNGVLPTGKLVIY